MPAARWKKAAEVVLALVAWACAAFALKTAVAPIFGDTTSYGGHDWDQMTAHRYFVVKALREFRQFPFWNPYACGGHPSWGAIESGTTIVSPFFPLYFLAPLTLALRVEVVAMAAFGALGAWLLAGRFTRSAGLRLFVVAAWALDGRWALQVSTGHAWHMYYAWSAWALWLFDRAVRGPGATRARRRDAVLAGAMLALLVYDGGIYPLPQTVLVMAAWSLALAIQGRTWAPFGWLVATGLASVGLAAPKLLPVLDSLSRFPRHIDSPEVLSAETLLAALTAPDQTSGSHPAPMSHWGWHEWGMYVGWVPAALLAVGVLSARTRVERALRLGGLGLLAVACGNVSPYAPWPLLRHLPIFSSQHVPSRWMYLAGLALALLVSAIGERHLIRAARARLALEALILAGACWVMVDVAKNDVAALKDTFWMRLPKIVAQPPESFHQEAHMPGELQYVVKDWAPSALGAEMGGVGVIECNAFPGLNIYSKDADGVIKGLGAKGRGTPGYRGEAFFATGAGGARISRFTPSEVTVAVDGASAGDRLVLNENWDPGWSADGRRAEAFEDTISTVLRGGEREVVFRYRPRTQWPALATFVVALAALVAWVRRGRDA